MFSRTTIANISAYFKCIVSYCCSPENETWKQEISEKKIANCSPYFTALQYITNLETERSYKTMANL